jgi:hypothetical protein
MRNALALGQSFELGLWVEAEVASLHASLLKDEELDLELAEKRADKAIALFGTFDSHLAARTRIKKAAIQRLRGDDTYFATFWEAIEPLDAYRDPESAEGVCPVRRRMTSASPSRRSTNRRS